MERIEENSMADVDRHSTSSNKP